MSFLTGVLASIGEWLLTKLFSLIAKDIHQYEADKAIDDKTKAEAKAETDAKTIAEKDQADRDLLSGM